jgi:hypothetical protein
MSSKWLGRLQFGKFATCLRRVCVNTGFVCHIGDEFWAMSFGTWLYRPRRCHDADGESWLGSPEQLPVKGNAPAQRCPFAISPSSLARFPGFAAAARGAHSLARRQKTGKLRRIQEIEMADGREAMPKRGLINGSFSLFA